MQVAKNGNITVYIRAKNRAKVANTKKFGEAVNKMLEDNTLIIEMTDSIAEAIKGDAKDLNISPDRFVELLMKKIHNDFQSFKFFQSLSIQTKK